MFGRARLVEYARFVLEIVSHCRARSRCRRVHGDQNEELSASFQKLKRGQKRSLCEAPFLPAVPRSRDKRGEGGSTAANDIGQ